MATHPRYIYIVEKSHNCKLKPISFIISHLERFGSEFKRFKSLITSIALVESWRI